MKARNATVILGLSVLFGVIAASGIVTMRQASAAARSARATERASEDRARRGISEGR
jgi:hypothetical protein